MAAWTDVALSKEEVHQRKREAVVAKAAQEFRKRGYHATSMDHVASALGVTKGALYRYVKSKDEVLFECFMQSNRLADMSLARVEQMDADGATKLQGFLRYFIHAYLDSNLAGGAMIEIDALTARQRKLVVEGRDRVEAALRRIIRGGQKDRSLGSDDPKMMIFTFMGAINWIPSWYKPSGSLSTEEIAETVSRLLVDGLRNRG